MPLPSTPGANPGIGTAICRLLEDVAAEPDTIAGFKRVLDGLATVSGAAWAGILAPDPGTGREPEFVARGGPTAARRPAADDFEVEIRTLAAGGLERTSPFVVALTAAGSTVTAGASASPAAALCLPLVSSGETVGVLCLVKTDGDTWGPEAISPLAPAASLLAMRLQTLVLSRHLERQEFLGRCSGELAALIAAGADEGRLHDFLTGFLGNAFGADVAAILGFGADHRRLLLAACADRRPQPSPGWLGIANPLPGSPEIGPELAGDGIIDWPDLADPAAPPFWRELGTAGRIGAILAVPLITPGKVLGLVVLGRERPGPVLAHRDRELFRGLVEHAAPLLENSKMLGELRHHLDRFKVLFDTSREVSSVLDLSEVPRIVAHRAVDLTRSDECILFLLDGDGRTLVPVLALSEYEAEIMKVRGEIGVGITGHVALNRVGEYVNRADLDPWSRQIPGTPPDPEALLAAPLLCADQLIGVMCLYKLGGREYCDVDLATITIFATQAAIAIANARLFERVAAERTRLSTMIQQMEEAVFLCGPGGEILVENSAARNLARQEGPLAGRGITDLWAREARREVQEITARLAREGTRNVTREISLDGRVHLGSFTALRDERGAMTGLVVLVKDITDLKAMESELLQSSKMSAVGRLATGVAHEFNNLIAAIYGYAQYMKDNRDERVLKKGISIILNSSERARDLTRSLLTFSRNSEGCWEAVDLNEVLNDSLLLIEQQLVKEKIRIVRSLDRLPHAWADRGRLQEVFLNLLSNARHAMPEGGTLSLTTRCSTGHLVVEVTDGGVGIPAENLERIFEPFFTTKGPLNATRTPGTGLGLFTVYNTVTAHGGRVEVESRVGAGTTVRVLLPLKTSRAFPETVVDPESTDQSVDIHPRRLAS